MPARCYIRLSPLDIHGPVVEHGAGQALLGSQALSMGRHPVGDGHEVEESQSEPICRSAIRCKSRHDGRPGGQRTDVPDNRSLAGLALRALRHEDDLLDGTIRSESGL